jgi:hypothetical protein
MKAYLPYELETTSPSAIPSHYGFWHLSKFARNYRHPNFCEIVITAGSRFLLQSPALITTSTVEEYSVISAECTAIRVSLRIIQP